MPGHGRAPKRFDGAESADYDQIMETRIAKLEEFAIDARERLGKLEVFAIDARERLGKLEVFAIDARERLGKLEDFAVDARDRLGRIEDRLDEISELRVDMHKGFADMTKWVVGTAVGMSATGIVVMTFVLNNAVPKAQPFPSQPIATSAQPIVINVQPAPVAAN